MVLYSQCDWSAKVSLGNWPDCSKSSCSNDVVAYSGDGSGEATCWGAWYEQLGDSQKNKYCCDQPDDNKKWSDCEWQGITDVSDNIRPRFFILKRYHFVVRCFSREDANYRMLLDH